jgi:hypothetical protein
MSRLKEVAKFACGAQAWHAFTHTVLWFSGVTIPVLGITESPAVHMWGAIGNAIIGLLLGLYAWRHPAALRGGGPARRTAA